VGGFHPQIGGWFCPQTDINANNQEDDLAIIANAANGFGYVADEAGNSIPSAASLNVFDGAVNQSGIISGATDGDVYVFTAAAGVVSINANPASPSPNLDIVLELRNSDGNVLVSSNPDTALNAAVSRSVTAGTYYVRVLGTGRGDVLGVGYSGYGSIGHYALSGTVPPVAPTITTQPASQTVIAGATVTFSVAATGAVPLRYQWRRNGGNISGATNVAYVISNVLSNQAGNYTVVVSNAGGTVTSTNAVLVVNVPPFITSQPQNRAVASGSSVTFSVTASGTAPLRYQWFKDLVALTGSTNATLLLTNVQPHHIGFYSVMVSNVAGMVLSTNAALNIPGNDFSQWQGLVAYYPFNGNANDAGGKGNNGTVNGATLSNDRLGASSSAYSFNGSNSAITFSAPPLTQIDNWTLSAWVNPASLSQVGFAVAVGFDDGVTGDGYGFGLLGNSEWQALFSGVAYFSSGYSMPATSRWYHVVMLRESGTTRFFVNGTRTANTSTTAPKTPTAFTIGSNTGVRFFNGLIDEVRIYNRALSPDEVAQLYIYEADLPTITALYDTGVGTNGTVLADGQTNLHYKLVLNPNVPPSTNAIVQDSTKFPIVAGPWVQNSSKSKWIGPFLDTSQASPGNYTYQLAVDLTGYDPTTAFLAGRWCADDSGSLFLNGTDTGFRSTFGSFSFFALGAGFVSGTNLIEFRVFNAPQDWTGLRVENLRGTAEFLTNLPLRIVTQPIGAMKAVTDNINFTVLASGIPPLSYQWFHNGIALDGMTNASLALPALTATNAGGYMVQVSDAVGTTNSEVAQLVVIQPEFGIFNTGVDSNGVALAPGQPDPHYLLVSSADPAYRNLTAYVATGAPIPPWVTNNTGSFWITPRPDFIVVAPGEYRYRLFFTLESNDVATASLTGNVATDDGNGGIYLNGSPVNFGASGWEFNPLVIPAGSPFAAGLNTLDFVVNNADAGGSNPSGLRVDGLVLSGTTVTLPTLTVSHSVNNIRLAWPVSATGFVLQEAMSPSGVWTNSSANVVVEGDENVAVIPTLGAAKFYRLRK
jgi:hypothetical protein